MKEQTLDEVTRVLLIRWNGLIIKNENYTDTFGEYIRKTNPLIYDAIVRHYEEEKREKA